MDNKIQNEEKLNKKGLIIAIIGLFVIAALAGTLVFLNSKIKVTFDTDGGSPIAAQRVKKGECVNQPLDPTKEGYDFIGWYLDYNKYDFSTPVEKSITIKAVWEKSRYVVFMVDGKEYAKEHIINGKIIFPENPSKSGYAFVEWRKESGSKVSENDTFVMDTKVSAVFREFVPVTSIQFAKEQYISEPYEKIYTTLVASPSNWAENIKYTSSDESVATVSNDGVVTTVGAGSTIITATTESGKTTSCEVIVYQLVQYIDVDISNKNLMMMYETQTLKLNINPSDATEPIYFSSDNENILKVDENGTVTAVGVGTAHISIDTQYFGCIYAITVFQQVEYLDFDISNKDTMIINTTQTLKYSKTPVGANEKLKFSSSDEKVLKVDQNGNVKAVGVGKAHINVDGVVYSGMYEITVIDLSVPETITLDVGETVKLNAQIVPTNTSYGIKYQSNDIIIATVDANGNVYGREGGTCQIKVYTDSGMEKTVTVYVNEYTLMIDLKGTGTAAILPNYKHILWYGNDRPLYVVQNAQIRVTEKGKDNYYNIDISKLKLITPDDCLNFWATQNELYATNFADLAHEYYRTHTYTVYFEYPYNGKTIKGPEFEITVEPQLQMMVSGEGVSYDYSSSQISLASESRTFVITLKVDQKVKYSASSNLSVKVSEPTPVSGQPAYYILTCEYSKTTSSSPASITLTTEGGQKIEIKYIR